MKTYLLSMPFLTSTCLSPLKTTLNATGATVNEHDLHEVLVVAQDENIPAQMHGRQQHRSHSVAFQTPSAHKRVHNVRISSRLREYHRND